MTSRVAKIKQIKAKLQGSAEAAIAGPYEVQCACGEPVTGVRRATWIEGECQSCLQSVFVLPANIYPSTPSVPSEVLGGSFSDRLKAVIAELFPRRHKESPETVDSAAPVVSAATEEPEPCTAAGAAEGKDRWRLSLPSIDVRAVVIRIATPFRLLMLAMVAVVAATGYWMTYQRAIEAAHQAWLRSADDAQTLLDERDFLQLEVVLTTAVDAGQILGKNDPEWRGTLNLLQETQAINSMAAGSLLGAFHRAYDAAPSLVDDAEDVLREEAGTGTFVFDSYLHQHSETDDVFLMEFPATPGRHAVDVIVPVPAMNDLLHANGDGRVIFAAKILSVNAPAADTTDSWKLQIDPRSFVLLTSPVHCEEIGLSPDYDRDIEVILTRQRDFVTSSEQWEYRVQDAVIQTQSSGNVNSGTPNLPDSNE